MLNLERLTDFGGFSKHFEHFCGKNGRGFRCIEPESGPDSHENNIIVIMEKRVTKRVEIAAADDKRQITAACAGLLTGAFLPIQQGTTKPK